MSRVLGSAISRRPCTDAKAGRSANGEATEHRRSGAVVEQTECPKPPPRADHPIRRYRQPDKALPPATTPLVSPVLGRSSGGAPPHIIVIHRTIPTRGRFPSSVLPHLRDHARPGLRAVRTSAPQRFDATSPIGQLRDRDRLGSPVARGLPLACLEAQLEPIFRSIVGAEENAVGLQHAAVARIHKNRHIPKQPESQRISEVKRLLN